MAFRIVGPMRMLEAKVVFCVQCAAQRDDCVVRSHRRDRNFLCWQQKRSNASIKCFLGDKCMLRRKAERQSPKEEPSLLSLPRLYVDIDTYFLRN